VVAGTESGTGLTAYVVSGSDPAPAADDLRQFLGRRLPLYMVPTACIFLDRLPLTSGGKIDRRALPGPDSGRPDADYVAPRSQTERVMAGIWKDVLGVGEVGIHGNFFDLGGASIQSLQIVALAYQQGIRIDPQMVFEYQTIAELAAQIDSRGRVPE